MNNLNAIVLVGMLFYFTAMVFSTKPQCPHSPCGVPLDTNCICQSKTTQKRSIECPPCISITDRGYYREMCPEKPVCHKKKRSTSCPCIPHIGAHDSKCSCPRTRRSIECPRCIPINLQGLYKKSCPGIAICLTGTLPRSAELKKRSVCPKCIPVHDVVLRKQCPTTPTCFRKKRSCPSCIPLNEVAIYSDCPTTPVCSRKKRSCSVCIPVNRPDLQKLCPTTLKCARKKRSCPSCIPLNKIASFSDCPTIPVCSRKKRSCPVCIPVNRPDLQKLCPTTLKCARKKRSCPSCIPLNKIASFSDCPTTPVCSRKKRSTNDDCPRCIPVDLVDYYKALRSCMHKSICVNAKAVGKE